jgi:hypothetical protein
MWAEGVRAVTPEVFPGDSRACREDKLMEVLQGRGVEGRRWTRRSWFVMTLLAGCATAIVGCNGPSNAMPEEKAIASIRKLGGSFERDDRVEGEPVVKVDLTGKSVVDGDIEALKALTGLHSLILRRTQVTDAGIAVVKATGKLRNLDLEECRVADAGMEHVGAMTSLRGLYLAGTGVTDAGLAHLRSLTKLWELSLRNTQISDDGLAHLSGLRKLHVVDLRNTRVSDAGIARLRLELPQARIVNGKE